MRFVWALLVVLPGFSSPLLHAGFLSVILSVEWWNVGIYLIAFGLAAIGYARWRTRRLRKRNSEITKRLVQQTQTLSLVTDELTARKEELVQNSKKLSETLNALTKTQHQLIEAEKMASLGALTAGIAHEINNPINFISGGMQALETALQPVFNGQSLSQEEVVEVGKEVSDILRTVSSGVTRTTSIISGLRNYASPDEETVEPVNIAELIDSALQLLKAKLQDAEVQVIREFTQPSIIQGNSGGLFQVIMNLADNAIFAMHDCPKKVLTFSTIRQGEQMMIKIRDTGEGIPEENQALIFTPFFTTKPIGKGTGLGLSISGGIIAKYGGTLTFTSKPGEGTEFCISLPAM